MKPQRYTCSQCGCSWLAAAGQGARCPNGCDVVAKSEGEFTMKTFQGGDDLKKGLR